MRSNAAKKQSEFTSIDSVELPRTFLKLVAKQEIEYNELEGESAEVDYEAFLLQYGIRSDFA